MAQVDLSIAGRTYRVACRDGGEARLLELAAIVDAKATEAVAAIGSANEVRLMLFAALLVADAHSAASDAGGPAVEVRINAIAQRIDDLAARLEERATNA